MIVLNLPKYPYSSSQHQVCDPRSNRCHTVVVRKYRSGGGDYIERNAFVLVELIKRVNQQLQANGSKEKITIFGPSMGGLISRYALSWMEKNNQNANCKLWVSFDSPHLGANVNLGLQFSLELMKFLSKEAKNAQEILLDAPAARQMLLQHYRGKNGEQVSGDPVFRTRFLEAMNNVGFPQAACLRKVALNNGSKNGTFQNFQPCSNVMKITVKPRPDQVQYIFCWPIGFVANLFGVNKLCDIPLLEFRASTTPANSDRCMIARRYFLGRNGDQGEIWVSGNGRPSADLIPGSNQNIFSQLTEKAKTEKWFYGVNPEIYFTSPTFVPSFSAFALKTSNPDWGGSLNNINIQTDTPFDAIYAPDNNEEHTELTKAGADFVRQQLTLSDLQCQILTTPLSNGCYTIKAKHSNKYMQPENGGNGARIRQYSSTGLTDQIFQLEIVDGNMYKIISKGFNRVWTTEASGTSNGTQIKQYDWNNENNQKWYLASWGDGTYKMEAKNISGRLADVEANSMSDGAGLHLWDLHGGNNQRFYFSPVSCTSNPTNCDFNISASNSNGNPSANQSLQLNYNCSGADCGGVSYAWSGNGVSGSSSPLNINAPGSNGTYTYTVTASKSSCSNKTATTSITVGTTSQTSCSGYTFTEGQVIGTTSINVVIHIENGCPVAYWQGGNNNGRVNRDWIPLLSGKTVPDNILSSCVKWDGDALNCSSNPVSCDFNISASNSNGNPSANQSLQLNYNCSGADCGGVSYAWSGNGVSGSSSPLNINAPGSNGGYTYTVTASKSGCSAKTANTSITVGTTNQTSCSGYTFTEGQVIGTTSINVVIHIENGCPVAYWQGGNGNGRVNRDWIPLLSGKTIPDNILSSCVKWDGDDLNCSSNPTNCDFNISASNSNGNPSANQSLQLNYNCSGADCGGVSYAWSGNGVSGSSSPLNINAPGSNGSYTYSVTASKSGCSNKTATTSINVGSSTSVNCNTLNGHFDSANCGTLGGWAYDSSNPNSSINVDILEGSTVILANVPAANFRQDLQNAGFGNGVHGFTVNTPSSLKNGQNRILSARVSGCSFVLYSSPNTINCAPDNARMALKPESASNVENTESAELLVSPNPNNGEFYAQFRLEKGQKAILQLLDVTGRTLYQKQLKGAGLHKERMTTEGITSGTCLVVLRRAGGPEVKRVVVVK